MERNTPPGARPSFPSREDCWSEGATSALIDAWGDRFLELNRGNLRQKHWQEVADAVNSREGTARKPFRTDVQCKNRIDTLKKKYKIEKSKILSSDGSFTSSWAFYSRLDSLIGSSTAVKKSPPSPPLALPLPYRNSSLLPPTGIPVAARSVREKRSAVPIVLEDSFYLRNRSSPVPEPEPEPDSESSRSSMESRKKDCGDGDGFRQLAQAIVRIGEIYERVEGAKQRQMIELEKQRMEFVKKLEFQRLQLFMDTQVQLEKIKRASRTSDGER